MARYRVRRRSRARCRTYPDAHRHRVQPAAPARIELQKTGRAEGPVAGDPSRRAESLGAADTDAVVGVREKCRGRDIERSGFEIRIEKTVGVQHIGSPRL